jgi:hypothetical protein
VDVKDKIKVLVTLFDHRAVEIVLDIPKTATEIRLLPSTIEKYLPDFYERCQNVAYSLLFLNFKEKVPNATKAQFFNQFMTTQLGFDSFKETLEFVSGRLKKVPTVEDLAPLLTTDTTAQDSNKGVDGDTR